MIRPPLWNVILDDDDDDGNDGDDDGNDDDEDGNDGDDDGNDDDDDDDDDEVAVWWWGEAALKRLSFGKNAPFFMSLADTLFDGEILKLRVNIDNWFYSSLVLHGMSTIYVNDIMSYKGARIGTFMLGTLQQAQISIHTKMHCSYLFLSVHISTYLFLSVYLAYCFFLPSLKVVSAARDYLLPLRSAVTWLVTN